MKTWRSFTTPSVDLNERNPPGTDTARQTDRLDFSRPDVADDEIFNRILWKMMKGDAPYPGARRAPAGGTDGLR